MFDILSNILSDKKGDIIFSCFGLWHFLFLFVIFSVIIIFMIYLKNKDQDIKNKAINTTINIAFGLYIMDFFLMPFAYGGIDLEKLPFHICTLTCVLCFISRHNQFLSKYKFQFAILGLISNLIYVIYPAGVGWYQISPLSYRVIQTLLFHGVMTTYGLFVLIFEIDKFDKKDLVKTIMIIICITLWAILGNNLYNNEERIYNWFFVIRDPFYILPKEIALYIMPFVMIIIMSFLVGVVYLLFNKIISKNKV